MSVDISGNLLSAGQYKGAAMDLAKNTKETSNELDVIKSVCMLIKYDLMELKNKEEGGQSDYKERAFLAEAMKRKLEEEILKIKMEHSYKIAEMEEFERCLQEENQRLKEYQEKHENSYNDLQKENNKITSKSSRLELELKTVQENYLELEKINAEQNDSRESMVKKLERFQKDQKQKLADIQEQINGKDKLASEMQKQNKILQEEKNKIQQDFNLLKKHNQKCTINAILQTKHVKQSSRFIFEVSCSSLPNQISILSFSSIT